MLVRHQGTYRVESLTKGIITMLNHESSTQRLALTRIEAAHAIGVSHRKVDALIADRASRFPVARVGRKVMVPIEELRQWLSQNVQQSMGRA
jgi:excisionase family DNA binding protein